MFDDGIPYASATQGINSWHCCLDLETGGVWDGVAGNKKKDPTWEMVSLMLTIPLKMDLQVVF